MYDTEDAGKEDAQEVEKVELTVIEKNTYSLDGHGAFIGVGYITDDYRFIGIVISQSDCAEAFNFIDFNRSVNEAIKKYNNLKLDVAPALIIK